MQELIIAGMITKDAELRRQQNGDPVCSFSLVIDNGKDREGNRRDGTFWECTIWGNRGEKIYQHLTKGKFLAVRGRPSARAYEGKVYLQCSVSDFTFVGQRGEGQGSNRAPEQSSQDYGHSGAGFRGDLDDDLPFSMEWR